ncbi:hypothetical protein IV203_006404 [Nitzschia inconspicua]|uniref:Uncharacterized protein n=1 Tax=Nitzschia inconspicua TaxID=303405 RepID=A0A9K3PAU3_9STRA|nr:hypothetical protein IV203_006404 [Nitzschia inconspicua]
MIWKSQTTRTIRSNLTGSILICNIPPRGLPHHIQHESIRFVSYCRNPIDNSNSSNHNLEAAVTAITRTDTTSTIQPRRWISPWGRRNDRNVSTIDQQRRQNRDNNNKIEASEIDDELDLITELAHNLTRPSLTKWIPSNLRNSSKFKTKSNQHKSEELLNDDRIVPSSDSADISSVVNPCDGTTTVTDCVTPNDDDLPAVKLSKISKGFFRTCPTFCFPPAVSKRC